MPRHSTARERMIETAARLFRLRGYNGVGLNELLEVSTAPKGSFYHHFPGGKEQLGEVAVTEACAMIGKLIDLCFAMAVDEAGALKRLASSLADHFTRSGQSLASPLAAIAIDAVPQSARLTAAAQAALAQWTDLIASHAVRLGREQGSAEQFAERLVIALEGAWMLARVRCSAEPFYAIPAMVALPIRP